MSFYERAGIRGFCADCMQYSMTFYMRHLKTDDWQCSKCHKIITMDVNKVPFKKNH